MRRCLWLGSALLAAAPLAAQEVQPDWFAVDGFETLPASAFRISDLRLRDPHLFVAVPFIGCRDFTDPDPLLPAGSDFNSQINAPLNEDSNGDGFLDSSTLLLFRPLDLTGAVRRIDLAAAQCTVPVNGTSCVAGADPPGQNTYATFNGLCLGALPGTTGGYSPAVPSAAAPCFTGPQTSGGFSGGGVTLPLQAVRTAATLFVNTQGGLELRPGLLRGFLTEAAADATLLPAELPIIGGRPLSSLFRGGAGNCSTGPSDKDTLDGIPGWWFYFEFRAVPVPYQELPPALRLPAEGPTRLWWGEAR